MLSSVTAALQSNNVMTCFNIMSTYDIHKLAEGSNSRYSLPRISKVWRRKNRHSIVSNQVVLCIT